VLQIRRGMAFHASDVAMAAVQFEVSLGVIERGRLLPVLRPMARFTGSFGLVRIFVATATGERRKVVLAACPGCSTHSQHSFERTRRPRLAAQRLVASLTVHLGMLSGEREMRLPVIGGVEGGRTERLLTMTEAAIVVIRRSRKLAAVRIGVALRAGQRACLVNRRATFRLVALATGERRMLSFQGECAALVRCAVEQGRLEARLAMASSTVGAGRASRKLAAVGILMTLLAAVMRDRPLEIAVSVTV